MNEDKSSDNFYKYTALGGHYQKRERGRAKTPLFIFYLLGGRGATFGRKWNKGELDWRPPARLRTGLSLLIISQVKFDSELINLK